MEGPPRDDAAFRALYDRAAPRIHAYARKVGGADTADEVVQDTFLRWLTASPPPMTEEQTMSYLFKIATRLTIDRWRSRARERAHLGEPLPGDALESVPAEPAARDLDHDLERALGRLRPRDRALLWLAYVEGQPHREVARALGLGETSVRVLLFRARRRLAAILEEAGLAPGAP